MEDKPSRRAEELYRAHARAIERFLNHRCGSPEVVGDVTSQTFEAALCELRRNPDRPIGVAWLMTVARRRLVDHYRRQQRKASAETLLAAEAATQPTVEIEVVDDEVLKAFGRLRPRHRRCLSLRYVDDQSVGDVAAELGDSYRSTESLLRRARCALHQELAQ